MYIYIYICIYVYIYSLVADRVVALGDADEVARLA